MSEINKFGCTNKYDVKLHNYTCCETIYKQFLNNLK